MQKLARLALLAGVATVLAALFPKVSPLAAVGVAFTAFAYLFVLALRIATGEISRFERDQRPDLRA
jgi:ABC-type Na+ efflux pump permease subunit